MQRLAFATLAVLAFACEVNTGEDADDETGGAGGTTSSGGKGAGGGTGGSGGTTGGTGGTGGSSGSGGGASATGGSGGTGGCTPNVGCTLDAPASTGDLAQDCVNRINQFRTECACLPPLERWTEGEACADQMAEYDAGQDSAHAGFQDDVCEGGSAQNECPGWRSEEQVVEGCLQAMWDEGPPPTESCSGACFQEHGHFINMTNERYTKVACGFFTTAGGEVWAVQNFSR